MNPDIFAPWPVPEDLRPYVRRLVVAFPSEPVDMKVSPSATGYSYFGWTPSGRWQGWVDGEAVFDTDTDGPFHLTGQIEGTGVAVRFSGALVECFAELQATGQWALFHLPGIKMLNGAARPELPRLDLGRSAWSTPEAVVDSICKLLRRLVRDAAPVPEHVARAVRLAEETDGDIAVSEITDRLQTPERQWRDDFTRIVGLSPKRFCRTLQINRALNGLLQLQPARLSELAAECGYSDQAHMTRSFVEFLGATPAVLGRDIEPTLARFVGHSRSRS